MRRHAVLVWAARLDVCPAQVGWYETLLSTDERAHAMLYRTAAARSRFIVRRGALRLGLARVVRIPPYVFRFGCGEHGKPYVKAPRAARRLKFNLAHSGGLALFGCSLGCEIGVDIEQVRACPDLLDVAETCFSVRERLALKALPPDSRTEAFYRCWTRKEAYVKAIGCGLDAPLQDFDVAFCAETPPALLRVDWKPAEPARWWMAAIALPAPYSGAVVVQHQAIRGGRRTLTAHTS